MDQDTITFLRALCSKAKETASLADKYLEAESKKAKKDASPPCSEKERNRVIPVTKWAEHHDWPTVAALRWLTFTSHTNGSDYFIRRAGRRLLIDEKSFFEWVNMSKKERIKNSPTATAFASKFKRH